MSRERRADHTGTQRVLYEKNRRRILMSQDICALCGRMVDKTLPYSNPMSATVDHKIPISKGGHPSSIENLQLAHRMCNQIKKDNLGIVPLLEVERVKATQIYQTRDWKDF